MLYAWLSWYIPVLYPATCFCIPKLFCRFPDRHPNVSYNLLYPWLSWYILVLRPNLSSTCCIPELFCCFPDLYPNVSCNLLYPWLSWYIPLLYPNVSYIPLYPWAILLYSCPATSSIPQPFVSFVLFLQFGVSTGVYYRCASRWTTWSTCTSTWSPSPSTSLLPSTNCR